MKNVICRPVAGLFLLFAVAPVLSAQTAPAPANPPSPPAASAPSNSDILELDQFVVSSTAATGYRATNSITATGIGTPIGNTPATIDVVTQDFIDDTRSDLINDALRYVPGVTTQPTNESQPFVRGFQGTYTLRNGVFRRQNLTTFNVDDVEVIQGPSSIFYSNIRPGGVINYNTIKPVLGQDFVTVEGDAGSYNYRREEIGINEANDWLALRVDLGSLYTNSFRLNNNETQNYLSVAATWKITANQSVTLEADTESVHRVNSWSAYATPTTNSRYWENPAAIASGQTVSAWMAANYPGQPVYNEFAPFTPSPGDPYGRVTPVMNTYQSGMDRPVDLSYVAKITDHLAFNTILNYAWEDNEGINPILPDPLANDTFPNTYAQRFINIRDSYNANARLTYRVDVAGVQNTLMAGDDNQWVVQRYPQYATLNVSTKPGIATTVSANNINSASYTYTPLTMGATNGFGLIDNAVTAFNTIRDTLQDFGGEYFVDQAVLFNKSLYLIAGDRYTDFRQHIWWPGRKDLEAHTSPDALAKKWTPELGALYKIANGPVSLYYTYSEAVVPQTQIDASGQTVLPINAKGWDAGVKLDLLGGALTGTVDYYYTLETNTAISNSAANLAAGLPSNATYGYYTYGNAQEVRGLQADVNYNISRDYQLVFGVNEFLEAAYVAPNSNSLIIGLPLAPIPATMYSLWNRYQFSSGPLHGLVLGGGVHHSSEMIYGSGNYNFSTLYTEGFTVVDAMIGYDFKAFGRPFKTELLVKNLSDEIYRDSGGVFGDPRTFVVKVSTRF